MEKIVKLIENIKGSGSYAAKMLSSPDDLNITIKDVGLLKFPLKKTQTRALIKKSSQAPFGYKDKTLVDLKVRNVWEIKKAHIKIENRPWNKKLRPILDKLQKNLDLPKGKIQAKLDKLLIYEKGQFFSPHQDSEKETNMLATLVIVLPSEHKGGDLVISHYDDTIKYRSSGKNSEKLQFFAFYTDCHHEIKKVTQGYRIALTYNLVVDSSEKDQQYDGPSLAKLKKKIADYFLEPMPVNTLGRDGSNQGSKKFVYLLDHEYTMKGLSKSGLKNQDFLRFSAFQAIAKELNLNIFFSLADVYECWSCEDRYYEDDWYDDDEEGEMNDNDYDLQELVDDSITVRHWKNPNGKKLQYGDMVVYEDEIAFTKSSNTFQPFESNHEGWMGNYGNTLERWYHRGAIVLWPKENHFQGIRGASSDFIISLLGEGLNKQNQDDFKRAVQAWSHFQHSKFEIDKLQLKKIIKIAKKINHEEMATKLLAIFTIKNMEISFVPMIIELTDLYGTDWAYELFFLWANGLEDYDILGHNDFIFPLYKKIKKSHIKDWEKLFLFLSSRNVEAFINKCKNSKKYRRLLDIESNAKERVEMAIYLFNLCGAIKNKKKFDELMEFICSDLYLFSSESLNEIVNGFNKIKIVDKNFQLKNIEKKLIETLDLFLKKGPRDKDDWSIKEKNSCGCADCLAMYRFFQSKTKISTELRMATERRNHLHKEIEDLGVYVQHETIRKGSPYTLILTKLPSLHSSEMKIFEKRKKMFQKLMTL